MTKGKGMRQYILDENKNPVLEPDMVKWGAWYAAISKRRVAFDKINGVEVSTVFLGLDHNYGSGPPVLWETMVFGGELDQKQDRCSGTWQNAEAMHALMLDRVKTLTPLIIIPKEHDVVKLVCDYAGLPNGSRGTVVNVYSPTEEEVEVEFANCNVISVLSRHLEIVWTPSDENSVSSQD